jgi:hypothetical protein
MADKPVLSQLISTTVAAEHVLGNCCRCTAACTYFFFLFASTTVAAGRVLGNCCRYAAACTWVFRSLIPRASFPHNSNTTIILNYCSKLLLYYNTYTLDNINLVYQSSKLLLYYNTYTLYNINLVYQSLIPLTIFPKLN